MGSIHLWGGQCGCPIVHIYARHLGNNSGEPDVKHCMYSIMDDVSMLLISAMSTLHVSRID